MRSHLRVYWLTCVLLSLAATASMATTIVLPTDAQLVDKSPVIVRGTVTRSEAVQRDGGIWTETTLAVSEVLKGDVGSEVTIREVGGRVGERFTVIFGTPRYGQGESVLVFLVPTPRGDFQTTDLFVGKFDAGTTPTGVRTWIRNDATDNTTVLDHNFQPIAGRGAARNAALFEQYITDHVAGRQVEPNYNIAGSSLRSGTDSLKTAADFTVISEPDIYRWTSFDSGVAAQWFSIGTQPGYTGGGVSEIQTAMAVWTGYSSAKILYNYAGTTAAAPGGNSRNNGINEVDFNDPRAEISGTWNPATGGVVGQGGFTGVAPSSTTWNAPFAADPSHPAGPMQAWTITEGNLVIQDGVSPTSGISSARLAEIVAHEFGHTLGFGHSSDSTALMYAYVTGLGAGLRPDDQLAARWLYPNGAQTPPPSGTTVPNAPTNLSAAVSGANVILTWTDNATNETSYAVYIASASSAFSNAGSVAANSTSANVSGLSGGTYRFYVVAVNAAGQSSPSNNATATLTASTQTAPTAIFTVSPGTGVAGLTSFTFVDQSTGSVSTRLWTFGDGSSSSANVVSHVYSFSGIYTVTLSVQNSLGQSSSASQTVTVNAAAPSLAANFIFMPSAPVTGQSISFLDQSTGGASAWLWSFGDGTSSSMQNPSKQYLAPGGYTVTLTVFTGNTSASTSRALTVTASSPALPSVIANFSFPATPVAIGTPVVLVDKSTGSPTSWTWSFGDGSTSSAQNPTHSYSAAGTYVITLNASNGQNSATSTHQVVVARPRRRAADK